MEFDDFDNAYKNALLAPFQMELRYLNFTILIKTI